MSLRIPRMQKQKFDPEKPHDGFTFDFVNKIFIRKGKGGRAQLYSRFEDIVSYSRNTANNRFVNAQGIIENGTLNTPRYDYNPANLTPRGLLVEQLETQICLESETFDSATWTKNTSTVTADTTTAPDNTSTADSLIEDATAGVVHNISQSMSSSTGNPYTFSVWAKANTRSWIYLEMPATAFTAATRAYFDLTNGVVGTTSGTPSRTVIEAYPNGWYRLEITKTATATAAGVFLIGLADADNSGTYNGDGTSGIYLWGAQYEQQIEASSYMPTTSATTTRQPDTMPINTIFDNEVNVTEGTAYVEYMVRANITVALALVYFNSNARPLQLNATTPTVNVFDGTNTTAGTGTPTNFVFKRVICSWGPGIGADSTRIIHQVDGSTLSNVTGTFDGIMGTSPVPTFLAFCSSTGGGNPSSIVRVRRIEVWPYRLSNSEMLAIVSKPCVN